MIYNSSLVGKKNIVLFCNQEESYKMLNAVKIDEIDKRSFWERLCFMVKGWMKRLTQ